MRYNNNHNFLINMDIKEICKQVLQKKINYHNECKKILLEKFSEIEKWNYMKLDDMFCLKIEIFDKNYIVYIDNVLEEFEKECNLLYNITYNHDDEYFVFFLKSR
jgi:hypothetical protein